MAHIKVHDDIFHHLEHIAQKMGKNVDDIIHPILKDYIIEIEGTEHVAEEIDKHTHRS